MVMQRKVKGTASSIPMGVLIGTTVSLLISILASAVTAGFVNANIIADENIGISTAITLILGAAGGACISILKIKRLRLQVCLLTGLCYYLSLAAMTALLFGGIYDGIVITAIFVLIGSGSVALLSVGIKKRTRLGGVKHRYR